MRLLLLSWTMLLLSCQTEPNVLTESKGTERIEAAYILENGLAYDGCEEMIRLQADSLLNKFTGYKPTPATLPLLQQALKNLPPKPSSSLREATVRFIETGKQVNVQCGWGARPEVPEIEILEITKR